jgi:hypothetical protein
MELKRCDGDSRFCAARLFASTAWQRAQSERGKAAGGYAPALDAAALRCAKGSLRYSFSWPVAKLAPLTAFAVLEQSRRVR